MASDTTLDEVTVEDLQQELQKAKASYEKLQAAHATLKGDLGVLKDLQQQVTTLTADRAKALKEREDVATAFEAFKADLQAKVTQQALTSSLEQAGVRSTTTSLKLIDRTKLKFSETGEVLPESLEEAINDLRTSDPELFKSEAPATTPPVKHAVETVTRNAYQTELAAAVKAGNQKLVDEVFEKYHHR